MKKNDIGEKSGGSVFGVMETDIPNLTLRALRRILRVTEMGSRQLATTTGLTPSQLLVLREIARRHAISPTAVALSLQFSQATITVVVDRLVASGFVTRQRSELDKRQSILNATQAGREALASAPDILQLRFQEHFAALPLWEQAMILAGLEKLGVALGAQDMEAAPLLDSGIIDRTDPDCTSGMQGSKQRCKFTASGRL
jgi:DNA-binding MarR family transcriptional regulator